MRKGVLNYAAESLAQPTSVTISLSLEGLFDGILNMFKQSAQVAEKPLPEQEEYNTGVWQKKLTDALARTLGDVEWVKAHYKENQSAPASASKGLSYKGQVAPNPATVVQAYLTMTKAYVKEHARDMKTYGAKLASIQDTLDRSPYTDEGSFKAMVVGKAELEKIKYPFPEGFKTPEGFAGRTATLQRMKMSTQANAQSLSDAPLKPLSVQEIVEGTHKLLELVDYVTDTYDLSDELRGFLNGMDEGFWRRDEPVMHRDYKFMEDQLFYESMPGTQFELYTYFHTEGLRVAAHLVAWLRSAIKE